MELAEAMAYIDSLELKSELIDFSSFTDEQLLKVSITLDLLSLEEAQAFEKELEKRNLVQKYYDMRK
ncbi:hypothetical protein IYQ92_03145 [Streptococcus sp. HF-1907]|uniref:hypothetical protein n=1 Tax=Streptococcus sp. HF-1907 TaxID=2785793 RepID=UPI00189DFB66|nr:hypothetical protein [Streptococcus sp. HF-1907]MBF7094262.1 hypothetical protein [Streptococcus sp. HF-1907]